MKSTTSATFPPGTPAPRVRTSKALKQPRLPENDFKIGFRPRTGLKLSDWLDGFITQGIQAASGIPIANVQQSVIMQVQAPQNLTIASTADDEHAITLRATNQIQLNNTVYELQPYH